MLTRRGFLGRLAGALAAIVAVPALLEADPVVPITITDQAEIAYGWSGPELLRKGDIVTIRGRYEIHPVTHRVLGTEGGVPRLKQFIVTQDATADDVAAWPTMLWPRLIDSGPYRNVSSAAPFMAADVLPWGWRVGDTVQVKVPQQYRPLPAASLKYTEFSWPGLGELGS